MKEVYKKRTFTCVQKNKNKFILIDFEYIHDLQKNKNKFILIDFEYIHDVPRTHKHVCVQKCQPNNKQVVTYHIDTLFIVPNPWLF